MQIEPNMLNVRGACVAVIALLAILGDGAIARAADVTAPEASTGLSELKSGTAQKHMVVAANPLAAKAGLEILQAGGSATDAAIAVQLVLNLVEP
ncbi:MAG: gamma-glutamyltransferase, partial [Rhodospirillaceae bacterium]